MSVRSLLTSAGHADRRDVGWAHALWPDEADTEKGDRPHQASPGRRRRRRVTRTVAALVITFVVAASGTALYLLLGRDDRLRIAVRSAAPGRPVLVVESGTADMDELRRAATAAGRPGAIQGVAAHTWLVSVPIVIERGARLDVVGGEVRLASGVTGHVAVEARGGHLVVRDAVVTSWNPRRGTPDDNAEDGRAYVLAVDGAGMELVRSQIRMLGYDAPGRTGLAWMGRSTWGGADRVRVTRGHVGAVVSGATRAPKVTRSVIEGSATDGLRGEGCQGLQVAGTELRDNGRYGILVAGCRAVHLRDNRSHGNGGSGIGVTDGADDVTLTGNRAYDNRAAGISLGDAGRVRVLDNRAWANGTGIAVERAARSLEIRENLVSGNREDGVLLASARSQVKVSGNRLDHNDRAGVWVQAGDVELGPGNDVTENNFGIWLEGTPSPIRVTRNFIGGNFEDGVALPEDARLRMDGNRISGNAGAFSVVAVGQAGPYLRANTVTANRADERLRLSPPVQAPPPPTAPLSAVAPVGDSAARPPTAAAPAPPRPAPSARPTSRSSTSPAGPPAAPIVPRQGPPREAAPVPPVESTRPAQPEPSAVDPPVELLPPEEILPPPEGRKGERTTSEERRPGKRR